jgi:hypothetical protein
VSHTKNVEAYMKSALPLLAAGVVFLLSSIPAPAYPHGGGLNAYGCHHNRKAGGYHCHRGQLAGQSFGSKEEMLKKLAAEKLESPTKFKQQK